MEKSTNILIKVSCGAAYSFFNSGELLEFTAGTKKCDIRLRGSGSEALNLKFHYDADDKAWFVEDLALFSPAKINKKPAGRDKPQKIKEGDIISVYPDNLKKSEADITLEVIRKINIKRTSKVNIPLRNKNEHIIGRAPNCDIIADNPQADEQHCKIVFDGADCYIEDLRSLNGTFINNKKVKRAKLNNYDRISIPGAAYIFFDFCLLFSKSPGGIEIRAEDIEKTVYDRKSRSEIKLVDKVSMTIGAGEFVAVVGGSGAGKSTLVDCLNGFRPATAGKIFYDGNDYYENLNSYRGVVGIVPQRDIMHDDLTLERGLYYTANLRMRTSLDKQDLKKYVQRAIDDVKLNGKENLLISKLSGGQKKRASIAMELLADPKAIFLDEPTSGLSPDLDFGMMELLRELSRKGRTIVIITHSMENIDFCDKVAVVGNGGRLCYFGKPDGVMKFFNAENYSKVFMLLSNGAKAEKFRQKFETAREKGEY